MLQYKNAGKIFHDYFKNPASVNLRNDEKINGSLTISVGIFFLINGEMFFYHRGAEEHRVFLIKLPFHALKRLLCASLWLCGEFFFWQYPY